MEQAVISRPEPHAARVESLIAAFEREFGRRPEGIAEAPGRVNLIGEHVDYNDGLVLPFAIDRSVMCAWGRSSARDGYANIYSADLHDEVPYNYRVRDEIPKEGQYPPRDWGDYPLGVIFELRAQRQLVAKDVNLALSGDVPQASGLSSSAAIELAVAGAIREHHRAEIDDTELALLCQRAENEYVGVQCGIMDQFASALSRRDHALLVDCRSLVYEHIPLRLAEAGLTIVIANSAVPRQLADSAYNDRRRECEAAVNFLREALDRPHLTSLRDVTPSEIADLSRTPPGGEVLARARHVITEIARVEAAVDALRRDDFSALGALMRESHRSLHDDYEVSSPELDLLVGLANAQPNTLGARLTGAGFGGCTVNLIQAGAVDAFAQDVIAPYRERTGLPAVMYVTSPQDGLRTWRLLRRASSF